jgi:hypothetical protein
MAGAPARNFLALSAQAAGLATPTLSDLRLRVSAVSGRPGSPYIILASTSTNGLTVRSAFKAVTAVWMARSRASASVKVWWAR